MILVTGATGLVGSYLVLHLAEKGLNTTAIYRNEKAIQKTKDLFIMYNKAHLLAHITWVSADLNDIPSLEIAFENIEYVYHCAAKISFDPRDEEQIRKVNIEGTANIVNFCLAKNVKKLCYVSSIAALGDLPVNKTITDEETDWNPEKPHSDYAISKYGAEMEIWRGQQEGLHIVIVNPGVILGAIPKSWNREEGSFKIISKVAGGLNYYTLGTTGFVGVNDVVTCMTQLMEGINEGERYILVSVNLSYQALTTLIADKLQVARPKKLATKWMTEMAWRWDWIATNVFFQQRKLTKAIAKSLHTNDVYSNTKITNELNYRFEPVEGVVERIADAF
ncbi:NAD-dependent epimerase/dehydratase family protein [Flavobacterium sp. SM2513]|uniref:NAD-dependent epimerase/dehydratase family protein n=1 Tax=Flavobacterium sp. SM2513 TaxID=3424766 RepID=UPI003D7F6718